MVSQPMPLLDDMRLLPARLDKGQKLLGLDLGTKTIGLAVSDTTRQIATPLHTIKRQKFTQDAAALAEMIVQHNIGGLVLGLPLNMDGTEGVRAQSTRAFGRNLMQCDAIKPLPLVFWDERLSTAAVERTLLEADTSRAKRAKVVDKMAASFILQGYLDFLNKASSCRIYK